MAKTISDQKFKKAAHLVDAVLLPLLRKIVDRANDSLAKDGIRIALDAQWAFDEIEPGKTPGEDGDQDG